MEEDSKLGDLLLQSGKVRGRDFSMSNKKLVFRIYPKWVTAEQTRFCFPISQFEILEAQVHVRAHTHTHTHNVH